MYGLSCPWEPVSDVVQESVWLWGSQGEWQGNSSPYTFTCPDGMVISSIEYDSYGRDMVE